MASRETGRTGGAAEKAAWRERFRRLREDLAEPDRQRASARIVAAVLALPEVAAARTVHLYWPLVARGEVDVRPAADALAARGVRVVLPAVVPGPAPRLVHREYCGADTLVAGPWGVREPARSAPKVAPSALDVVVVPGLAMGRDGSRLGYGGGYYDTFLPETRALRVGVVWAAALCEAVPAEPHDARLDVVVTEAETWHVPPLRPAAPP